MSKPAPYTVVVAGAYLGEAWLERIFMQDRLEYAIRLRRLRRPIHDFAEDELLILIGDAIAAGVFSPNFLAELREILDARKPARYA